MNFQATGSDLSWMGYDYPEAMGARGFKKFVRQTKKAVVRHVAKVVKPITHIALKTASALPGGSAVVTALRTGASKIKTAVKKQVREAVEDEAKKKVIPPALWGFGLLGLGLGVAGLMAAQKRKPSPA